MLPGPDTTLQVTGHDAGLMVASKTGANACRILAGFRSGRDGLGGDTVPGDIVSSTI